MNGLTSLSLRDIEQSEAVNETDFHGYTVAYSRDETQFPVYVMGFVAAVLIAAAFHSSSTVMFAVGLVPAACAYYNFPLLEAGRPRLGANQYGVFIDGFGIIHWRAIDRIELVPIAVRVMTVHELHIALKLPLGSALIADWRKMPFYRLAMRLPWTMTYNNMIRITVDPFDKPPDEIHRTLLRMWRHYRS